MLTFAVTNHMNPLITKIKKKIAICLGVLFWTLASFTAGVEYQRGDVDQDGQVGISDVTCLIDYLLTGTWGGETPVDNHEYVDLGLPSGTLWATCNVGAISPEEYGDYFAWGETSTKEVYNWGSYKWCEGTWNTINKYCIHSQSGTIDGITELEPEDDAAYVNWGESWRMPSKEQVKELVDNCSYEWTAINGVNGELFTAPNGNTLFFPAASGCFDDTHGTYGTGGFYWMRSLSTYYSHGAICLYLYSTQVDENDIYERYYGFPVRAVRVPQE